MKDAKSKWKKDTKEESADHELKEDKKSIKTNNTISKEQTSKKRTKKQKTPAQTTFLQLTKIT